MIEHIQSLLNRREYFELFIERGLKVFVIIAVVFVGAKFLRVLNSHILAAVLKGRTDSQRNSDHDKRLSTVIKLLDTTLRIGLYATGALMALRELGLDITPFLTGAGIAGVAVGFGAQSLVKDVISGTFLLIEDQIRVGDVIKVNSGLSGTVERMQLRITAIRDSDGTLHTIPNGQINSVSNMTHGFGNAVIGVPVPYSVDLARMSGALSRVVNELGSDARWKAELLGQPGMTGITKFEPDHMIVEVAVRTLPHSRWNVAVELRRRIKAAFDAEKLEFPKGFTISFEQPD